MAAFTETSEQQTSGADLLDITNRIDNLQEGFPRFIPQDKVRELSKLDNVMSLRQVSFEWAGIMTGIWFCSSFWHPVLYIITLMWLGARLHGLGVLMHEAVHYRVLNSRRLNDLMGEILLSWPLFLDMREYRRNHFAHHRNPNTVKDPDWLRKQTPDWDFPKSKRELISMLIKDLIGVSILRRLQIRPYIRDKDRSQRVRMGGMDLRRLAFYLIVTLIFTYLNLWGMFFMYWVLPLLTWLNVIAHIRSIAEHFAIEDEESFPRSTRTTLLSLPERIFVAPNNVNYHIEHHLYPSVPFYRLPQIHSLLMRDAGFREKAHITRSYWGLFSECLK